MKLSFFVGTRNGSTRNPPSTFVQLLQNLRELGDELVVVVDDTTTDDTLDVAKEFTKNVYLFAHDPLFMEMRRQSFYRCTGDWIFWIDDDDILSSRWTRPVLEYLLAQRTVTHYWIPGRYLVTESGLYLSTAPFIGHFHPQLYRNIESIVVLPSKLHQHPAIAGEPAYLAGMYLDAMDFVWHGRTAREAKLNVYEEVYDEWNTDFDQTRFYLYEDYYYETRQIDDTLVPRVMAPMTGTEVESGVHVLFLDCPERMTASQTYWVTVRIVNSSDHVLLPQSEFIRWGSLAVTYRWLDGPIRTSGAGEDTGLRAPFPARILPRHEHDALIRVRAPGVSGTYRLQMDIVDQNESSLLNARAGQQDARTVEVTPLVWPPRIEAQVKHNG